MFRTRHFLSTVLNTRQGPEKNYINFITIPILKTTDEGLQWGEQAAILVAISPRFWMHLDY